MPGPTAGAAYEAQAGVYDERRFTRRDRRRERRQSRRATQRAIRQQRRRRNTRRLARVSKGYGSQPPTVEQATAMLQTLAPKQRETIGARLAERYALTEQSLPKRLYRAGDRRIELGDKRRAAMTQDLEDLPGWVQTAVEAATYIAPVGPVSTGLKVGATAGKIAAKSAASSAKGAAKEAVEQAAKRGAAREAAGSAKVAAGTARGGARGAAERGLGAAQRAAGAAGKTRGGARATVAARAAGKTAKGAGKTAAKPVAFSVRHPVKTIKYSALAQTPVALSSGPGEAWKDLTTTGGVAGDALRTVGSAVDAVAPGEVASNLVKDAFELPAAVVPATYMAVAGAVEAAQGDPERLEQMWEDYKGMGLFPALAEGDLDEALSRIKEHPLFLALEARGGQAALGRTAGAITRTGALGKRAKQAGATDNRKDLDLGPGMRAEPRGYSRDLIEKAAQVALDRRAARKRGQSKKGIVASKRQREGILDDRVDRLVGQEEGARRAGRDLEAGFGKELGRDLSKADKDVLGLAVRGLVTERNFVADLASYGKRLAKSQVKLRKKLKAAETKRDRVLIRARIKSNQAMQKRVQDAIQNADPARVFAAVRKVADRRREHDAKLAEKTGQDARLEQARLIPAARVHLGAKYRKPTTEKFDRRLAEIDGEVKRANAELRSAQTAVRAHGRENQSARQRAAHARRNGDAVATRRLEAVQRRKRGKVEDAIGRRDAAQKRLRELEVEAAQVRSSKARFKPGSKRLVDSEGEPISGNALEQRLRAAGVDPDAIAFVSNSPSARGPGSYYRALFPDRQSTTGKATSGKAVLEGTFDASFEAVVEQAIRSRGINDALTGFDRIIGELAVRAPGGKQRFSSWQEAADAARNAKANGLPRNVTLRPVRLAPLHANSKELKAALKEFEVLDTNAYRGLEQTLDKVWGAATTKGDGPVVLLPEQALGRLQQHFQAAGTGRKVMQVLNQGFKGVVLPLSPGWYVGNFLDVSMRAMFSGTTLYGKNAALGRKFFRELEKMDPDEVKAATGLTPEELAVRGRAAIAPGGLFGNASATRVHREAREFTGKYLGPLARSLATLRRTPGPRQAVNAWLRVRDALLGFNEFAFERQAQYALMGKTLRQEARLTRGKWENALRVSPAAMDDLARGFLKTENQIKYAKKVEETLGQWTANSPMVREWLVDYAPFGMWLRASWKFVGLTLPAKHPIKLAIAASLANVTEEERAALGLSPGAEGALPFNLQGSVPLPGGGVLPVQKFTSFGMFSDPFGQAASMILPQVPLDEMRGLDWTGNKLTHEDGTPLSGPERALAVLGSGFEAYVPFYAKAKQVTEDGPLALNPLKPITDPGLIEWLRAPEISIRPSAGGSSSSSSNLFDGASSSSNLFDSGSSSDNLFDD